MWISNLLFGSIAGLCLFDARDIPLFYLKLFTLFRIFHVRFPRRHVFFTVIPLTTWTADNIRECVGQVPPTVLAHWLSRSFDCLRGTWSHFQAYFLHLRAKLDRSSLIRWVMINWTESEIPGRSFKLSYAVHPFRCYTELLAMLRLLEAIAGSVRFLTRNYCIVLN